MKNEASDGRRLLEECKQPFAVQILDGDGELYLFGVYEAADQAGAITAAVSLLEGPVPGGCDIRAWKASGHLEAVPQRPYLTLLGNAPGVRRVD